MIRGVRNEFTRDPIFGLWMFTLGFMLLIGLVSAVLVLLNGLEITNLTNNVPWGLWITIDLSSIALGAGAFSLSALVYLLRIERLRPIVRIAVFTGLIGYTGAMLALFMDIGRPERFWHPTVYWNIHSVLWEITMCVMLYTTVLATEFAPIVLESKFMRRIFPAGPRIGHFIHRFAPFAAVLGLGLSLLHQSSLGATYGVLVARPIWFKPSLPVMFILSAVGAGATFVLGVTVLYENFVRQRQINTRTRTALSLFAGLTLLAYLYLTLWDYLATNYYSHLPARVESIDLLNRFAPYGTSFWVVEVLMGLIIPAIILLTPALRRRDGAVIFAMFLVIAGIIVNRWNVTLSGLIIPMDWSPGAAEVFGVNSYRPAWVEWGVGVGVVAYIMVAYTLGLRYLPFFTKHDEEHDAH
jgi:Ni/Fe-hydrogenase subunit HybB-like protein